MQQLKLLLAQNTTVPPIINPVITGMKPGQDNALSVFGSFFSALIGVILVLATIWSFFQLLLGGLEWISSGGDKSGLENARNKITNSLLGLIITFSSWAIFLLLLQFLGISPLGSTDIQLKLPKLFGS